jgi:hypothetical protein
MDPLLIGAIFTALATAADGYEQSPKDSRLRQLITFLGQQAAMVRAAQKTRPDQYANMADYLLDRGGHYPVKTLTEEQRAYIERAMERSTWDYEIKQCFANSQYVLLYDPDDRLTYVEGYVFSHAPIPVHHAWVIIDEEVPVELTIRDPDGPNPFTTPTVPIVQPFADYVYFGVTFASRPVIERFFAKGELCTVLDDWQAGWPELQQPRMRKVEI